MLKCITCLLTFSLAHAQPIEAPFWKVKSKVYERVKNGDIIVSVTVSDDAAKTPLRKLRVGGGGHVKAPHDFVFATAQKFAELSRSSSYIKRSEYNLQNQILSVESEAFGHQAKMQVKMKVRESLSPQRIEFEIVEGTMLGFKGVLTVAKVTSTKSEVGLSAEYSYDRFPIPKFFLEFGLEAIFQRMALRLRYFVEDDYELARKNNSSYAKDL